MPARSVAMLIVLATSRATMKTPSSQLGKSLLKISGQALPRHLADSGTHHLNRGHQRPRQECGPKKLGSKLRDRNGICRNAGWVIVGSPGDYSWSKRPQQQSHPSNWGKCRHEQVGMCTLLRMKARIRSQSYM